MDNQVTGDVINIFSIATYSPSVTPLTGANTNTSTLSSGGPAFGAILRFVGNSLGDRDIKVYVDGSEVYSTSTTITFNGQVRTIALDTGTYSFAGNQDVTLELIPPP